MYLEAHLLQTFPISSLNRDANGEIKTLVVGGTKRQYVSSQAFKRPTRLDYDRTLPKEAQSLRTSRLVPLLTDAITARWPHLSGISETIAAETLTQLGLKTKKKDTTSEQLTEYLLFLGEHEIDGMCDQIEDTVSALSPEAKAADIKQALKGCNVASALTGTAAPSVALFGRMVADNNSLSIGGACQVADAFSVHNYTGFYDTFTAVDDRAAGQHAGAGMFEHQAVASSTLYRYANINLHHLAATMRSEDNARQVCAGFFESFIRAVPGGKANSHAQHTLPFLILLTASPDRPSNLAGAYSTALQGEDPQVEAKAINALGSQFQYVTDTLGVPSQYQQAIYSPAHRETAEPWFGASGSLAAAITTLAQQ